MLHFKTQNVFFLSFEGRDFEKGGSGFENITHTTRETKPYFLVFVQTV